MVSADRGGVGVGAAESVKTAELDPQLTLFKGALLDKGSSDQIRINAAAVLLLSDNPLAREILLGALKQAENVAVWDAVCKALIQAGMERGTIGRADDFIEPLLGVMAAESSTTAKLAAEATLIFPYERISEQLDKIINDDSVPLKAKLIVIYALELHPDVGAAVALLRLVDNPQQELADDAKRALLAIGISAGEDAAARKAIIKQLKAGDPTAFLQRRLIRKESLIRSAKAELALWQNRYLTALGEVYAAIADDTEKAKFLAGHLSGSETVVRLWALERIRQDRVGTRPNPKLPSEVGAVLVALISDSDRNVRLKTAGVLSFMTEVDSAQQLLAQLGNEQDGEVRMELFSALSRACYIAFLPNSKVKIAPEIRKQTLEWAVKYLSDETAQKARKGAEALRMLLEQDGLTDSEADKYFGFLANKYLSLKKDSDGPLRGELLSTMASLCGPQSVRRDLSIKQFGPLFEAALTDKTDSVRESAVDGLAYIDKAAILKRLRKDFVNDASMIIRKKLINLAAEVGGKEDLPWLAGKVGVNSESEPAWQAMLKIFNGADADTLSAWVENIVAETGGIRASDSQRITFLEIAERKAVAENKPQMLQEVRENLAELYKKTGQFELSADYLSRLYETAATAKAKRAILPDLMYVYLRIPEVDLASKLVENCLQEQDLDTNDAVLRSVDDYFAELPAGAEPNGLLDAFGNIQVPRGRPLWQNRLREWMIRFGKVQASGKLEPDGT
ncbi:MAG: HEAT repeat domain-containing protein [Sedimentisphaerales bacterium]|nr:HEAT repeat domain-containing protein [Sedimentisphaerales bacterium]